MVIKTIILGTILGLGFSLGAYLWFSESAISNPQSSLYAPKEENQIPEKPFVENLSDSTTGSSGQNLTDFLTTQLGQKIIEQNPGGPVARDGQQTLSVPDAETIAKELLQEAAAKFDPAALTPTIEKNRLVILSDNSKESLRNYIVNFNSIIEDHSKELAGKITAKIDSLNTAEIKLITDSYQKTIDKFYALGAPSKALAIHEEEIKLLGTKLNIFKTILNYEDDPVGTILASGELDRVDAEFLNLRDKIEKFINDNRLND